MRERREEGLGCYGWVSEGAAVDVDEAVGGGGWGVGWDVEVEGSEGERGEGVAE